MFTSKFPQKYVQLMLVFLVALLALIVFIVFYKIKNQETPINQPAQIQTQTQEKQLTQEEIFQKQAEEIEQIKKATGMVNPTPEELERQAKEIEEIKNATNQTEPTQEELERQAKEIEQLINNK